jgi:two-component system NtrC family sensor kinase
MLDLAARFAKTQEKDFPYFRHVWNRVVLALMAASFIPLILIGGGMYYYATSALKEKTLAALRTEVLNHKEAIDEFLAERTMDLRALSANLALSNLTAPEALETVFLSLRSPDGRPCFADLGVIDDQGTHLAYVGPYDLISKNYKDTEWFKAVMENNVYVSDVFLGFRNIPHFIIAVKQVTNKGSWIIRATVDTAYFDSITSGARGKRSMDAFLVNRNGIFQTSPGISGKLMGQSEFKGLEHFEGVKLEEIHGKIRATTWLSKVPWLCVVGIDQNDIFEALQRVRRIGIYVFVLGAILIVFTVLLTTNQLVSILEAKRRSIRFLDQQLRRTNYMASLMEFSYGFFQEINDTLANIDIAATWIQDQAVKGDLKEIEKNLGQIKSEVSRSRKSIDKFIRFIRPYEPAIIDVNVNELLNDLIEFLGSELRLKKITIKRDYEDNLPNIRSDHSKLRQVFQNIVLNAMTAVEKDGEISLTTRAVQNGVAVTIADNGPGIPEENMENIFDPLFTTKPEGAGLGLSICFNILEKLGGRISAKSEPEKGAAFTVELPLHIKLTGK